jgi:hypothetical protein
MFERAIGADEVLAVIAAGETISEYADDKPYPSRLLLGVVDGRPIHVVVAKDESAGLCVVVTLYQPTEDQWGLDFKTRRTQ